MIHPLQEMMQQRRTGVKCGIPSYCSANEIVLEAALKRAKETKTPVLIEATANQVNQFGGYTGMKAKDFYKFVKDMAAEIGLDEQYLILAGDHLGPLTWQDENEESAMEKAEELIRQYVKAGFTKIHLDTSMKLGDDPADAPLQTETVAKRGTRLYKVAMEAYEELKKERPDAMRPVFVIGSEVPIPGGSQEEAAVSVTKGKDFENTVNTYKRLFKEYGCEDGWKDIIAVVVQPGVEFGDSQIHFYDREEAKELCGVLKNYPEIVFEGHSTDYQSPKKLKQMVEDGIAILKVGPALTLALREALFALSMMEKELVEPEEQANFIETLEAVMLKDPENWIKHYHGDEKKLHLARKYSFSDRCRYYIGQEEVVNSMKKLLCNMEKYGIPVNILHQYMPVQYNKVRDGKLELSAKNLVIDAITNVMKDYEYATKA